MAAASGSTEDLKAKTQQLHQTVFADTASDAESVKQKEEAIGQLSDTYVKLQDAKALTELLSQLRPFFAVIPKAKTAKIVRNIIDQIAKIPNSTDIQVRCSLEDNNACCVCSPSMQQLEGVQLVGACCGQAAVCFDWSTPCITYV
jgi:hypothetical protein